MTTNNSERRSTMQLSEEELDNIASKAAEKAIEKMTKEIYSQVGKAVISKLFWLVGLCTVGLYLWFKSKGLNF